MTGDRRECAINDCTDKAAGIMEWPNIGTRVALCRKHADFVGAVEHGLSFGFREPMVHRVSSHRVRRDWQIAAIILLVFVAIFVLRLAVPR